MSLQPIFPTPLEQLRFIAQLFDLPIKNKKALDDKVDDKNVRQELMWSFIKETWFEPLEKILPKELAEIMNRYFAQYLFRYLKGVVGQISVDGMSREELMPILAHYFFSTGAYMFLAHEIPDDMPYPRLELLLDYETKSVGMILDWLNDFPVWQNYLDTLKTKEEKDKIERWKRGEYLPSYQAILLLKPKKLTKKEQYDWGVIAFWLLIARALDETRKLQQPGIFKCMNIMLSIEVNYGLKAMVYETNLVMNHTIHKVKTTKNAELLNEHLKIFVELTSDLLSLHKAKDEFAQDKAFQKLNIARSIAENHQRLGYSAHYWNWLEARWHLLSGNLKQAVALYETAFHQSLFCMGDALKNWIVEARIATAFLEKQYGISQRKFLAHLKNAMILFDYEMESTHKEATKLNHKDVVTDWEVEAWAKEFHRQFPKQGWFTNVHYPDGLPEILFINTEDVEKLKPDYRNPNKKITIGGRKKPQLIWFIALEHIKGADTCLEIMKNLLEAGADVNQLSDTNESALLFAIEMLDLKEPSASQDRRFFDLLAQYPHAIETINALTAKREKFPLFSAVNSGRPDVVRTLLQMGAEVDKVNFQGITSLYQCIGMINRFSKGKGFSISQMAQTRQANNWNQQEIEFLRRERAVTGIPMNSFIRNTPELEKIYNMVQEMMFKKMFQSFEKYSSIQHMEEIAYLLLDAGADPNFPHNIQTLKGYTPLMMAIEANNPNVFNYMKDKGGDTTLLVQSNGMSFTCADIKHRWNSDKIVL